ncbi:MAG: hypothetical protein ACE5FL_02680 [Myxococcota bacterium]
MSQRRAMLIWSFALLATWSQPGAVSAEPRIEWRSGPSHAVGQVAGQTASRIAQLVPARGDRHLIVQFKEPLSRSEKALCADAGLRLLAYLGKNAYFASVSETGVDRQALARISSLFDGRAVAKRWKLHPYLAAGREPGWAVVRTDGTRGSVVGAYILFHSDVSADLAGTEIVRRHGGVIRAQLKSVNGLVIELPLSRVGELADEDGVQYIEPALPRMR